jgi:hypothetical protein
VAHRRRVVQDRAVRRGRLIVDDRLADIVQHAGDEELVRLGHRRSLGIGATASAATVERIDNAMSSAPISSGLSETGPIAAGGESREARPIGRRLLREAAVLALFVALALFITRPWLFHARTHVLGHTDPQTGVLTGDVMFNMSFGGWFAFSLLELRQGPLEFTRYLMYPGGAAHGNSFDGLLYSGFVALLSLVAPLPFAHNLAILVGFILCGWFTYRLAMRLWPSFGLALTLGVVAEFAPYLLQRGVMHPNLQAPSKNNVSACGFRLAS